MVKNLRNIEIFISSPSDVSDERKVAVDVINELNSLQHINTYYNLQPLIYEIETPGVVGDTPQRTVDQYMAKAEDVDIFVCIMWSRMGTPVIDPDTGNEYQSGTHYEFVHAYESNQKGSTPIILLYRCVRAMPAKTDFKQVVKVQAFFEEFESVDGKYKGLYKEYESTEDFEKVVRNDISKVLLTHFGTSDSAPTNTQETKQVAMQSHLQMYLSLAIKLNAQIVYQPDLPISLVNHDFEDIAVDANLIPAQAIPNRVQSLHEELDTLDTTDQTSVGIDDLLENGGQIVIFGGIGSGKTVLIKRLATNLAKRQLDFENVSIPLYISGMELALFLESQQETVNTSNESLFILYLQHVLQTVFNQTLEDTFWKDLLERHRTLLILDGLDEIVNPQVRTYVMDKLTQLRQSYIGIQTVVTMRPNAFINGLFNRDYHYTVLRQIDLNQQEELIGKLQQIADMSEADEQSQKIVQLLNDTNSPDITANPLFFTCAYVSYLDTKNDATPLQSLVYDLTMRLKLREWDTAKLRNATARIGVMDRNLLEAPDPSDHEILVHIAWQIYMRERETLNYSINDVLDWLQEYHPNDNRRKLQQLLNDRMRLLSERSNMVSVSTQSVTFNAQDDLIYFVAKRFTSDTARWDDLEPFLKTVKEHNDLLLMIFDLQAIEDVSLATQYLQYVIDFADTQAPQQKMAEIIHYVATCYTRFSGQLFSMQDLITKKILAIIEDVAQGTNLETRIALGRVLGLIGDPRIGSGLVRVPAGEFFMGYDIFPEDRPARPVEVADFYIDKYPVTNEEYARFVNDNGYQNAEYWTDEGWEWVQANQREHPRYWHDDRFNFPNYPVVGVSWYEAYAYAKWAGKRLPTEEEWEKAARGRDFDTRNELIGRSWTWGNEFRSDYLNCGEGDNPVNGTTPIGIYPAGVSPYGIYDMSGNVSEWTSDWFQPYKNNNHQDSHFGTNYKIRRGGGWSVDQDFVRCTCRIGSTPDADYAVIGFRCVILAK